MGLLSYCNSLVSRTQNDGFNLTLNTYDYNWGCNSDVLNKAIMLLAGYTIFNNQPYFNAALSQMNYILGTNAHNISFITGIGEKSVLHPHHRPSGADNITAPVPGLLAGGPDRNLSDTTLSNRFNSKTPPALCYLDIQDSYASNEICINWNAPLVFVAGYFNNAAKVVSVKEETGQLPSDYRLEQNFPNPFNPDTTIKFSIPKTASKNEAMQNVSLKIYDILGRQVASLINESKYPGSYQVKFNAGNLPSGSYFYELIAGNFTQTKKMILMK